MSIEEKIKNKAKDIGFDLVGIAGLNSSVYREEFRDWIEKGMNSEMEYLRRTREARLHPKSKFPWAKSVVVLGINYWQGNFPEPEEGKVRISRYALGKDYHGVMPEKLSQLSQFIKKETKAKKLKYYTDTGSLLEKELAQRAGLGWIGKNTLLITEEFGSWVFLGEILLDIELKVDRKAKNRCGDCEACLNSCPTGALVEPYSLDTRECIAYHTVENGDTLPSWFPPPETPYIFGCDICQEACPFNKKAKVTKTKEFLPDKRRINPSIQYLESLSKEEFKELFGETPVNWAGREIFLRNLKAFSRKNSKSLSYRK